MYPAKPGLIIGFHGCDKAIRDKVVSGKISLNHSTNRYDWLGNGIYFWENNQQRAQAFATELKEQRSNSKVKIPAVLGAVIDLGFCLDLLDSEYIDLVTSSYNNLHQSFTTLGIPVPRNLGLKGSNDLLLRNLDCAVIENLPLQRRNSNMQPFDSVRGVFIEGGPLYENAGFFNKNHIQICIRNPNCIKGFFIPRISDNNYRVP